MSDLDLTKVPDRILEKVLRESTDCWVWTGQLNRNGYGRVSFNGRKQVVHRILYLLLVGPIPEGLVLDHTCRNRACCNPRHMEPVTVQENTRRGEAVLFRRMA